MQDHDEEAIRALIGNHFEALHWAPGLEADWERFAADFLPDAQLFPAARPVQTKSVEGFIARMKSVALGGLHSFEEHTRGMRIMRFGNIAVVLASSELLENGAETDHDVSGYLLVKTDGDWRIAAHAWDEVADGAPLPDDLR